MGYANSTTGTAVTKAFLDEINKQLVLNYATAAARNADAALSAACREGIVSYQVDENTLKVQRDATLANISTIGPIHGGGLAIGSITCTQSGSVTGTASGEYFRFGRWIQGWLKFAVTGTGTAANDIVIGNIPVTASTSGIACGTGEVFDTSASNRACGTAILASTTTMAIRAGSSVANNFIGNSGISTALASGDTIVISFNYVAAADA